MPASAYASGYFSLPETTEKLRDHNECIAQLEAAYSKDLAVIKKGEEDTADTSYIFTFENAANGIEQSDDNTARYQSKVSRTTIEREPDMKMKLTGTFWDEIDLVCEGQNLTTNKAWGHDRATFSPLD